jgi:predicted MFS family arabinose efflux permease
VAARLPWLLLSLVAGAVADRLDRRQTMLRVNLFRAVLLGGLAVAVAAGAATLPTLYAAALLLGAAETLFDTSAQSLLPAVVPREELTRANSRLYAVELVANVFVGPPLGGLLAGLALAAAFGLPAAAYLAGAGCLALVTGAFRPARQGPPTRLRDDIVEGVRFVWRHPVLRPLALMLGVGNLAFTAHGSVLVLFAVAPGPMGLSEAGFGVLTATIGAGALLGTWLAVPAERRLGRARTLVLSVALGAASLLVPALTPSAVLVGASLAVGGLEVVLWNVVTVSLRQRISPTTCSAGSTPATGWSAGGRCRSAPSSAAWPPRRSGCGPASSWPPRRCWPAWPGSACSARRSSSGPRRACPAPGRTPVKYPGSGDHVPPWAARKLQCCTGDSALHAAPDT